MLGGVEGESSRMTSPLRPEDPARIGDYEIVARIGKGGQGVVYLGQAPDGTRVAVKVMETSWASDSRARNRFAKEIETASKVAPFCTAALLDADIDAEPPYIVSEYIEGPSLREAVLRDGPRSGAALDRLAISTATALVAIHQAGVVHRDFKPANVLLGPDGPRVIDFGIARSAEATMTATNSIVGTPAYMAPEQVEGRELTPAVDIFAWAGVMVFAATGESPFHDETLPAIINRVLNRPPRLDGVDERLRPLLEACLAKEPERRPTAVQVLGALVGHDPASVAQVPVEEVLENGYTAALSEQTQIAATAVLPIPTAEEMAGAAPTAVLSAAEDAPDTDAPERPAAGGLAALAAARPTGEAPDTGPASGPMRTTSGLAALVDTGPTKQVGAAAAGGTTRATPPGGTAGPRHGAADGAAAAVPGQGGGHDGGHGLGSGGAVPPSGQPPLPRRSEHGGGSAQRTLSWIMAAGILIVALAGGWYLISAFLSFDGGRSPEATPVDGATTDVSDQEGDDRPDATQSVVDHETEADVGGDTYAPNVPADGQSTHPPMEPHLDPTAPEEEQWTDSPGWEEDSEPTEETGTQETGTQESAPTGNSSSWGSGEAGRVAVSPTGQ